MRKFLEKRNCQELLISASIKPLGGRLLPRRQRSLVSWHFSCSAAPRSMILRLFYLSDLFREFIPRFLSPALWLLTGPGKKLKCPPFGKSPSLLPLLFHLFPIFLIL